VADRDDLHVLVGKRQFDDALNRDAVVRKKESVWHLGLIGCTGFRVQTSEFRLQSSEFRVQSSEFALHTSDLCRALALMKSMMSCIGVPGRKIPLTPISFSLGMSTSGIIPPMTTRTSSSFLALSNSISFGAMWL